jgi:hypothetical protein
MKQENSTKPSYSVQALKHCSHRLEKRREGNPYVAAVALFSEALLRLSIVIRMSQMVPTHLGVGASRGAGCYRPIPVHRPEVLRGRMPD